MPLEAFHRQGVWRGWRGFLLAPCPSFGRGLGGGPLGFVKVQLHARQPCHPIHLGQHGGQVARAPNELHQELLLVLRLGLLHQLHRQLAPKQGHLGFARPQGRQPGLPLLPLLPLGGHQSAPHQGRYQGAHR